MGDAGGLESRRSGQLSYWKGNCVGLLWRERGWGLFGWVIIRLLGEIARGVVGIVLLFCS